MGRYTKIKTALLLSGGIDSSALAFWKKPDLAITIDYGQLPAEGEIRASRKITEILGIKLEVISIDCRELGSGDLAGKPSSFTAPVSEWWPFRNQLLVTFAAMQVIDSGVNEILVGSVNSDERHADGTKDFYLLINKLVFMQEGHIKISVPAINLSSKELVEISKIDEESLAWTHSCHISNYACGLCRGCNKHRQVMAELGYEIL